MCTTELECLQNISGDVISIKAFCYALGVALAVCVVLWFVNKIVHATIGQAF